MSQASSTTSSFDLIPEITLSDAEYNRCLQDKGLDASDKSKRKVYKSPNGDRYKDIYAVSRLFIEKVSNNQDRFPRFPRGSHTSNLQQKVGDYIFQHRILNDNGCYDLPQQNVHFYLSCNYGMDNETSGPTVSDKARVFGIIMLENFEDERSLILKQSTRASRVTGSSRIDRDDPSLNLRNVWMRIKDAFHDSEIIISNPTNWIDASDVDGFENLKANDPDRIRSHKHKDADFFKRSLFNDTLSIYRETCRKYRSETGNGSGKPEDYTQWDVSEDKKISNYSNGQMSALLTWIFMKDRESSYILEAEKDAIPTNLQIDEFYENDSSVVTNPRRSPTNGLNTIISTIATASTNISTSFESISKQLVNNTTATNIVSTTQSSPPMNSLDYFAKVSNTVSHAGNQILRMEDEIETIIKESSSTPNEKKRDRIEFLERMIKIQKKAIDGVEKALDSQGEVLDEDN